MNYEVLHQVGASIVSLIERKPELARIVILCFFACIYRFAMNTRIKVSIYLDYGRRKRRQGKRWP